MRADKNQYMSEVKLLVYLVVDFSDLKIKVTIIYWYSEALIVSNC